eukprot:COSAG04_NODE_14639_length_560_cov_2.097614_1_plen_102_part_01
MVGAGLLLSALLPLASPSPLPTCGERVAGLGLACNSTCACPASTGCVPVPTFAPAAAKCMPTYDDVKVVHVINSCHLVRRHAHGPHPPPTPPAQASPWPSPR